jgi:hypothetical protein
MSPTQEEQLINDVHEVKSAIVGNEKFGQIGLVARMDRIENWRVRIDLRIAMVAGATTAVIAFGRYLLTGKF